MFRIQTNTGLDEWYSAEERLTIAVTIMGWIASIIITGVSAFVATNIDDIVLLMLFFSQVNATFRPRHIVLGQYLGFVVLVALSLPGFFGGLLIPKTWIGLLGLLPIWIGLQALWHRDDDDDEIQTISAELLTPDDRHPWLARLANLLHPRTYSVAVVTVANGGDNVGIYVPLFANSSWMNLLIILAVFAVLVSLWCYLAYHLAQHPAIAQLLTRYSHILVPLVLIGLGIAILIESRAYQLVLPVLSLFTNG